jgi:hypothetical protein
MRFAWLCVVSCALLAGCAQAYVGSHPSDKSKLDSKLAVASAADKAGLDVTLLSAQNSPSARRIIYKAALSLVVEDFGIAEKSITELVAAAGGYVAQFREDRTLGDLRGGQWVLRVPVEQFEHVLDGAAKLGVTQRREVQSEDVSEEYVDLTARLKSKQEIEARMLELIKSKTDKVADILTVETELGRVREEFERVEGRLRYLADRVVLTTITIDAREQRNYVPPEVPSLAGKIAQTFQASLDILWQATEAAILTVVALVPFVAVLLLVLVPMFLCLRWLARRRPAAGSAGSIVAGS